MTQNNNSEDRMTFLEHLGELRKRLTHTAMGVVAASIITLYWSTYFFEFLTRPIRENFGELEMIGTGPAEAFIIKLKTGIAAGLLLSAPYTFLQVWKFVAPGLYPQEKRIAIPFVLISTLLFFLGISFCYYIMLPYAFQYFSGEYLSLGISANIKVDEYMTFVIRLILVFGLVFELPVLCFFLTRLSLINHHWLIKNGRYSVLVIFIIAAILTPPDIISQLFLALPLMIIYLICIAITYFFHPKTTENKATN